MALKDTDYLYCSSNIRATEGCTNYKERLNRFLECKTVAELYEALLPNATEDKTLSKQEQIENYLNTRMEEAFTLVSRISPDKKIYRFLKYEYDCCNLKLLVKCQIKGIVPSDELFYHCGNYSVKELQEAVLNQRTDALPKSMAKAVLEAQTIYAKTKSPKDIDLVLDKACFADMLENAKADGVALFFDLVQTRIDKINIVTFLRIANDTTENKRSRLLFALLEGGSVTPETFANRLEGFDGNIASVLAGTKYATVVSQFSAGESMIKLEKLLDDCYLKTVQKANTVPFGAEVACAYLIRILYETQNVRVILAGILSGLDKEQIRERVRFGYV